MCEFESPSQVSQDRFREVILKDRGGGVGGVADWFNSTQRDLKKDRQKPEDDDNDNDHVTKVKVKT